jgi:multiple antibiotic resistance protein
MMLAGFPDTTLSFFITSFISLFVIIDPTGNIFPFLALSAGVGPGKTRALAGRACLFAFIILTFFVAAGRLVLTFFGIGLPAGDYRDIALIPLAMPLLSGPGAISTVLVLTARSKNLQDDALLVGVVALIMLLCYLLFISAARIMGVLKATGLRLLTRLMGLILAALAVEFIISGLKTAFPTLG